MSTATAERPVSWTRLGGELGLDRYGRHRVLAEGLVTPTGPTGPGHETLITSASAERAVRAARIAALVGLAVIVVLRVLTAEAKLGGQVPAP